MSIQAVIFDMDGVLVDSEVYWLKSREEFAQDHGKVWKPEFYQLTMGVSTEEWGQIMRDKLELNMPRNEIIVEIKRRVIAHYEVKLPTRPGALEAVKLAAQHYKVGLASGSPTEIINAVMRLTGLDQVFEVIVYGDDIPNGKPAPDIYLEAMRQLNVTPDVSVGIEDSGNGIRALKAAGMYAIAAPSPDFPLKPEILAMADACIASLEEFSVSLVEQCSKDS